MDTMRKPIIIKIQKLYLQKQLLERLMRVFEYVIRFTSLNQNQLQVAVMFVWFKNVFQLYLVRIYRVYLKFALPSLPEFKSNQIKSNLLNNKLGRKPLTGC